MRVHERTFRSHEIAAGGGVVHVVEAGDPHGPPVVLLHGWPQSWHAWDAVMLRAAADGARVLALDLPGIGHSATSATDGSKTAIAAVVREALVQLGVTRPTLVGHDAGAMVAYAYARSWPAELERLVLASIVIAGVEPWDAVRANPHLWHFGLHAVPDLPELLVAGREHAYFDYFYAAIAHDAAAITPEHRAAHAASYASPHTLKAGFDLYRAFDADAQQNRSAAFTGAVELPLLYLRGDHEYGDIDAYARGFQAAGFQDVSTGLVAGAGHFGPEEAPEALWAQLRAFARLGAAA